MRQLILVAVLVIAACDTAEVSPSAPAALPTRSPATDPTPSPATPTPRSTPEPTPLRTLDPETALDLWLEAFEGSQGDFFGDYAAEWMESTAFYIDSVDRATYDPEAHRLVYEISNNFQGIYERDPQEWQDDTWETVRDFAREIWQPYRDELSVALDATTPPDWPTWTPGLRIDGNDGDLLVTCPGALLNAIADRDAAQGDYAEQCQFKPS